jgi:tetratricopeptide (TPR) repeat protein
MDSVDAVVTGSFTKAGNLYETRIKVEDPRTNAILGMRSAQGEKVESIISSQSDELCREIAKIVGVSSLKVRKSSQSVADVTTKSPEALKYFIQGKDHSDKYEFGEARRCFDKAIALDSTFASAYYYYVRSVQGEFQPRGTKEKYLALAMKYLDRASWKEQRYILAMDAAFKKDRARGKAELTALVERYPDEKRGFYSLAGYADSVQESIRYYERAIEIDPLFKLAYNQLAGAYDAAGDFEKALAAVNKYIELAPDEGNPYDTKGGLYICRNMPGEALAAFEKSGYVWGDSTGGCMAGELWLLLGDVGKAERVFGAMAAGPSPFSADGRTYMGMTRMFEGRFKEALRILEDGIAADERDSVGIVWVHEQKYLEKAVIYLELGDGAAAAQEVLRFHPDAFRPLESWVRDLYFYVMAHLGSEPLARDAYRAWRDSLETPRVKGHGEYWWALGLIALSEGKPKEALAHFLEREKHEGMSCFLDPYLLGQAYIQTGEPGEAIAPLEKSLEFCETPQGGRLAFSHLTVKARYHLGKSYEAAGIKSKAIENYRKFLDFWKNADSDRPEVPDAKRRLARLS